MPAKSQTVLENTYLQGPAPCDDCAFARRCGSRELACKEYYLYTQLATIQHIAGVPLAYCRHMNPVVIPPVREPSRAWYNKIYRTVDPVSGYLINRVDTSNAIPYAKSAS